MARPNAPSVDIKDKLVSLGVGTFAATSGWGIYIGSEPDGPDVQDTVITLYDSSGGEPNPAWLLDEPHVQVRVRGSRADYTGAYDKAYEVLDALLGLPAETLGGTVYTGIWALNDPFLLGYDDSRRPVFTVNFRIVREPTAGDHRNST